MSNRNLTLLTAFIITAKKATYVGDGAIALSCRPGSHDLTFADGDWFYRDSYFGGTDFLGQEVVWQNGVAVWAMNYHGTILRPDLIDGERAGNTLKAALAGPSSQGRLCDNFDWSGPHGLFAIRSEGDIRSLRGRETITVDGCVAYALDYQAGLVTP